ncbi:hypothetical protein J8F10_09210 [Gemmata sp. G18]|uniref:Cupin domain-containing protein n=1 Tax=Gemmata palustris TaxID=2822762 RepID=A0ABS5BP61_9BACT|nr:hypothetical protein [Gemmata palustris]MBP3955459.1 hypothetical protein [Gemmata palustris]
MSAGLRSSLVERVAKRLVRPFYREPDFYIGGRDNPYLLRWWVIPRNRLFNIYLHKFLRDDDDRALHDHPWISLSVILKGGYIEHTTDGVSVRFAGGIVFRRATHAHRLELLREDGRAVPAWTLFITGPKIREWGFHCPQGWRHWREFTSEVDSGNVGKGCEP